MSTGRRSARREAVFILYQQDLLGLTVESALKRSAGVLVDEYAKRLVYGVGAHRDDLDGQITRHITGWSLERLGILERAILRTAAYELAWEREVPDAVVINEAVALAKRFCSAEAGALVNGVLGALAGSRAQEPASGDSLESGGTS